MMGAETDICTVSLSASAPIGGLGVHLASSSSVVILPASVTVAANASSAQFTATVSSVASAQAVTLTASAGSVSESFLLELNPDVPTLSINATNVAFGSVSVNTPATQSVTLTSTGSAPVTVYAVALTGAGYALSGATVPVSLNPSQAATLNVEFDPTTIGPATGQLTISSDSSTGATAVIGLSGIATAAATYAVNLAWDAPSVSDDPLVGYNVYRSSAGSSNSQLLNQAVVVQTTYADSAVQDGQSYDYVVKCVDAAGVESTASNIAAITVP
jgi:hypothetical protein